MSEYTPSRQELLTALVYYRARDGDTAPPPVSDLATTAEVAQYLAESERGLAEVERAAAEKAYERGRHDERHDCDRRGEYERGEITLKQLQADLRPLYPYRRNEGENE